MSWIGFGVGIAVGIFLLFAAIGILLVIARMNDRGTQGELEREYENNVPVLQ